MKRFFLLILLTDAIIMNSCRSQLNNDSPFMVVVKLQSAENDLAFDEAKNYIDVERVYSVYPESTNPEKEWIEAQHFFYNLGKDKKFSNTFAYYKYRIEEVKGNKQSMVKFIAKDVNDPIKEIVFSLEFIESRWMVVAISYKKGDP